MPKRNTGDTFFSSVREVEVSTVGALSTEITNYMSSAPAIPQNYWPNSQLRILKKFAQKLFAEPTSSSGPERHFSVAGNVASSSRANLKPDKVSGQAFLSINKNMF